MKTDYTHITVILDRSGSMQEIRGDVIGGFNALLAEHQATEGLATLSLVQFDTQDPYEVIHSFKLLPAIPQLTHTTYVPRGGTPLLDAMGHAINDLDASLSVMQEKDRPAQVVVVTITDGQENSSREFNRAVISRMIAEKQERSHWQFVFLSADLNAINDAMHYGVRHGSTLAFDKSALGSQQAFASVSSNVASYRRREKADMDFTPEDRSKHEAEKRRGK